jgi:hypothetical protein
MKNKSHLQDYLIITIGVLLIVSFILGFKLYNKSGDIDSNLNYELQKYKDGEEYLNRLIENNQKSILLLKLSNDSLMKVNEDINKKRKINYKKYQDEIKRNKNVSNDSVVVIIDSILRSNNIRK